MEKIFEQYGGVIVTVIAIIALIGLVTFLVKGTNAPLTQNITKAIEDLFKKGTEASITVS